MDIKTIAGILGLVITLGGLFVQVGQILNRLEVVEGRSVPNIAPLEKELSILRTELEGLKARNSNPLMR